jgi:hypothetical protein
MSYRPAIGELTVMRLLLSVTAIWLSIAWSANLTSEPFHVPDHAFGGIGPTFSYAQYDATRRASPVSRQPQQSTAQAPAIVYLMRGFMNIFSLGMDELAAKIQAHGIAATVANHADADGVVHQIVTRYHAGDASRIILIGHSLGADAVIAMAQALDRYGVPVALVVLFDASSTQSVPGNVATAVNFTLHYDLIPAIGFHGTISNVNLRGNNGIDHFSMDKLPSLQAQTLDYVLQAAAAAYETQKPPMRTPGISPGQQ